jgi:formate hydrogenlyase transcriptional activator
VLQAPFHADLLYRLNVFPLTVPPLSERRSDIPLLVGFFVTALAKKLGKQVQGFSRQSMDRLLRYDWPGNVRELQNIVERAVIVCRGPVLEVEPQLLGTASANTEAESPPTLDQMERAYIIDVLRRTRGVVEGTRGAASILDLHPNTLRSRMKKLGIERRDYDIS